MFFRKRREQRKNDTLDEVKAILPAEANLVSFDYNGKVFGNIVVEIEIAKIKHTFTTHRGDIYHNGKMLCNSSYHYIEKEDTFPKLIQIIKQELGI